MLEYFPPIKNIEKATIKPIDLSHHTRCCDASLGNPSVRASTHFKTLKDSGLEKKNSILGTWFEFCIYDAFVASGIDPSRMRLNVDISYPKGQKADVDIIIDQGSKNITCIFLKTSLRERWKQVDRDSMIAEETYGRHNVRTICIFYMERHGDSLADLINKSNSCVLKSRATHEYVSVLLQREFNSIVQSLLVKSTKLLKIINLESAKN